MHTSGVKRCLMGEQSWPTDWVCLWDRRGGDGWTGMIAIHLAQTDMKAKGVG